MKKLITIAIIAILCLSVLAACKTETTQEETSRDTYTESIVLSSIPLYQSETGTVAEIPAILHEACVEYGFTNTYTWYLDSAKRYILYISTPGTESDITQSPSEPYPKHRNRSIHLAYYAEGSNEADRQRNGGWNSWEADSFTFSDGGYGTFTDGVWTISDEQIAELIAIMADIPNSP
ncbi:hypothetical protein FWH13_03330 [Candidatus Saccharibacteria bacterium]|nr:hypothetical protein [Candidatus Saccharibacteria bacterium]